MRDQGLMLYNQFLHVMHAVHICTVPEIRSLVMKFQAAKSSDDSFLSSLLVAPSDCWDCMRRSLR